MELRQIRYFTQTVRSGTVSAAAAALNITQPGLSRQLQQLEADLGVTPFERRGGRLILSHVGQALLPRAERLADEADRLKTAAIFHAHGHLERLTVAAPTVTLSDVMAPFVAVSTPEDPTVDVMGTPASAVLCARTCSRPC